MNIIRIGQVVLYVTDLAASRHFYVDVLGLNVLDESSGALYLRGVEDREWTLKLEQAPRAGLKHIGYKVASEQALEDLARFAENEKLPQRWEREQDRPHMLRIQDPFGFPVVFYYQSVRHKWLLQSYHLHRGPGIQRIDHTNAFTPEVGAMTKWYVDKLGFRLSEYSEDDAHRIWAAWIHRRGSVHDLAMTNGTGPRLHHLAYWLPDGGRIAQTCDILASAGCASSIERGPGRHGISNAHFVYLRDPDGHRTELYTSDYLTVDPDFEPIRWHVDNPMRQQLWGGIAPKSWFTEGSSVEAFEGGFVAQRESELKGMPSYAGG